MDIRSDLSIIIPNHNERLIDSTVYWCGRHFPNAEIIVEHDFEGNGKGYTLREGLKKATRNWIVFLDGDMDILPCEIHKLINNVDGADVVVGIKSTKNTPFSRKVISHLSRRLIKMMFNIPLVDTQTGIKLFKRETLSDWETDGFLCDIEIIYKASKKGFKIAEVPVDAFLSKAKTIKQIGKTLWELIILKFRLLYR